MARLPTIVTPAQMEALRLAANGLTARQIATRLNISEGAAHLRLNGAAHALGAHSRTHAVALAIRTGLMDLTEVRLTDGAQKHATEPLHGRLGTAPGCSEGKPVGRATTP
ncbi:response regulator transcription factor [Streptomyces fradiae]